LRQKVLSEPEFVRIALFSEKTNKIKEQMQADWERFVQRPPSYWSAQTKQAVARAPRRLRTA
jgi:hypothetical protein